MKVKLGGYRWHDHLGPHDNYEQFTGGLTPHGGSFFFFRRPEKMIFPKKSRWNIIFLLLSGKMTFLFPANVILTPGRKTKDDLSRQKNTWKYDIFFKCSEKMVFSKKLRWNMIFLVLFGKMVFFPPENMIVFPWAENQRWSFSRNTCKYDIFCINVQVLRTWCHDPLPKKIKDDPSPQKYT